MGMSSLDPSFRLERQEEKNLIFYLDFNNCTKTDTSEKVENTKVLAEKSLGNSAKFFQKFAIRKRKT